MWRYRELLDSLRLVVDLQSNLTQLVRVLLAVVGTEEKLEPAGQSDSNIGLCAAPIATIGSSQLGAFDD